MQLQKYNHAYLIGIGGISVSAIAKLLLHHRVSVSGFDVAASQITEELSQAGACIETDTASAKLPADADLVVYSDAVPENDPLRIEALDRNITTMSAFAFWGAYAKDMRVVAISGTNGKSTTAALVGLMLERAGFDPTVVVGTRVLAWDSNIRIGSSQWLVIEADEYHAHMLLLRPAIACITNITADHLDFYRDIGDIQEHFQQWIDTILPDGGLVINRHDPASQTLSLPSVTCKRFAIQGDEGFRIAGITVRSGAGLGTGTSGFNIIDEDEDWGFTFAHVPGKHNLENITAAAATAALAGVKPRHIMRTIESFTGTWRRFEILGERNNALIVSDYAHHPDAIRATIAAARDWFPRRRIVALFQPHQHNRTRRLFDDFAKSFDEADYLILSEIYYVTGRVAPQDSAVSSRQLLAAIQQRNNSLQGEYAPDLAVAEKLLKQQIRKGDVVLIMGAGTVDTVARKLVAKAL